MSLNKLSVNKYFRKLSASVRTVGLMRTTGKKVKKTMYFAVILLVLAGTLCGCSDIVNKQPLYVYGFGLDTREAGVMLYVLCGEGGGVPIHRLFQSPFRAEDRAQFAEHLRPRLAETEG